MTPLTCPHCGDLNPSDAVRCEGCGYSKLVLTDRELERASATTDSTVLAVSASRLSRDGYGRLRLEDRG